MYIYFIDTLICVYVFLRLYVCVCVWVCLCILEAGGAGIQINISEQSLSVPGPSWPLPRPFFDTPKTFDTPTRCPVSCSDGGGGVLNVIPPWDNCLNVKVLSVGILYLLLCRLYVLSIHWCILQVQIYFPNTFLCRQVLCISSNQGMYYCVFEVLRVNRS